MARALATRTLVVALGDQLDPKSAAFDGFDRQHDAVFMAEAAEESEHVWSHKARIAVFLSAMRHFRDTLLHRGLHVHYRQLDDPENLGSLGAELAGVARRLRPRRIVVAEPGEFRVAAAIQKAARKADVPLEVRADRHFLATREEFAAFAASRKQLRLEHFYRQMRRKTFTLIEQGEPIGGRWNYDAENRQHFGHDGPGELPPPHRFAPDATTRDVLALVESRFADHPGSLDHFAWPVTPQDARKALRDFVQNRLAEFGRYQDAMWTGQPFLYHSLLSSSLNLKLLDPREAVEAAVAAYRAGRVPLAAAEGFIRQILGWREYVRGIYWQFMPEYLERNALGARLPLPDFYWTGRTEANCLRQVIGQTLQYGYAHHIQRLMVTGLYAMLLGVDPREVHKWYLAVYVDAVEWVELPNTLGMSQFADGGAMASKPYAASGKYIQRMSNYCTACRYKPDVSCGADACPVTTLYWDFLLRHRGALEHNQRMMMQVRNLDRRTGSELRAIRRQADAVREDSTA